MSSVLFQDGDWRIYSTEWDNSKPRSMIYHRCGISGGDHQWWQGTKGTKCMSCHERIPDAIKGLWRLHEWDR